MSNNILIVELADGQAFAVKSMVKLQKAFGIPANKLYRAFQYRRDCGKSKDVTINGVRIRKLEIDEVVNGKEKAENKA